MKRSFFGPLLFLGIITLFGAAAGLALTLRNIAAQEEANVAFIASYRDDNDYNALFIAACGVLLQCEYAAFPASGLSLGLFIVAWAFDRRKMFRKVQELQKLIENDNSIVG
jgi:hypothetical protein